ncbi:RluA family pseudouridine synthase [Phenylobacterium sp.]|uniref:RluA family pseudouridine synthase n=1 Tax=Phenylobacterium sp. TaxID=1871053 RepID=UPI0025D99B1F|nr:RluA family pseudouridine synthase [Phenylobacterium sp.]MCA3742091.1 RluA family pseudouridine synthase [Phenylobacterium sp.]
MKPLKPVPLSAEQVASVRSLVFHNDPSVLALNKPAGLSSQGGRGQVVTLDEMLWAFAKPGKARPRLIHRLDRDTSGVILAARTQPAASFLGKAMMARKITKTYLAMVAPGAPIPPSGRIMEALRRVETGREARMQVCATSHPDAEAAETYYRTLSTADGAALLEVSPRTGRMHQIRVHLAAIQRPIVGDAWYGGALMIQGLPAPRLMLHASALTFPHPDGGRMTLRAPLPADFASLLEGLGLRAPDLDGTPVTREAGP